MLTRGCLILLAIDGIDADELAVPQIAGCCRRQPLPSCAVVGSARSRDWQVRCFSDHQGWAPARGACGSRRVLLLEQYSLPLPDRIEESPAATRCMRAADGREGLSAQETGG